MTYKLFIDDERAPATDDYGVIARSSTYAIDTVLLYGIPTFISFDHDLGGDDTSMVFIHWLIDYMLDKGVSFPEGFGYYVHSQNPVGKKNIESLMDSFMQFQRSDGAM